MVLHVISVGGSLIVPGDNIDIDFLSSFKQFIIKRIEKGDRFILIAGGGKTARKYQDSAAAVSGIDNEEKDWIGIHSTRLNAHLLRTIFKLWANPKVVKNFDEKLPEFKEKVLIGAGWKPGWSTDYIATLLAKEYDAKSVINLSNIEYVYSEDPKVNPDAKKYENISWEDFREIVGDRWDPGMSAPFDPIASKEAQAQELKVAILNGKNLTNLGEYFDKKKFKGTLIE
ncbi:MAG: UMP kinase [Candidatus Woesearchaeota archaeon]|jgi:uridylate kinase|nr:UMP kinase [Candidatus Woesearchaeota archaeon]